MKDKFINIIIDVPERFIGKYKNYRVSITQIDDTNHYDYDIIGSDSIIITEDIVTAINIDEIISVCVKFIDKL